MSEDLERRLRAALRPVDPGEKFTQSVLARAQPAPPRPVLRWISLAVAASVLLCVGLVTHERQSRAERGLEARRQLLQALQMTSKKLDLAYRAVNEAERDDGT